MGALRRPLGIVLAAAMLVATGLDAIYVRCVAGPDHRAIELVGHADGVGGCDHGHGHDSGCGDDHHPGDCDDSSLLDDLVPPRASDTGPDQQPVPAVAVLPAWDRPVAVVDPRSEPRRCPRPPPPGTRLRTALDDLATLRLLI